MINEDCIKLESRSPRSHLFLEKMLLAVIDPRNPSSTLFTFISLRFISQKIQIFHLKSFFFRVFTYMFFSIY